MELFLKITLRGLSFLKYFKVELFRDQKLKTLQEFLRFNLRLNLLQNHNGHELQYDLSSPPDFPGFD